MVNRRGVTLLELAVAGILLGTLLTVCLQMVGATAARRRAVEDRQTAMLEAGNVMERLAARPWDELTPEAVAEIELSSEARESLLEGRLEVDVTRGGPDEPDAKRVAVLVRWNDRSGKPQRPVRLVAWRYRRAGE